MGRKLREGLELNLLVIMSIVAIGMMAYAAAPKKIIAFNKSKISCYSEPRADKRGNRISKRDLKFPVSIAEHSGRFVKANLGGEKVCWFYERDVRLDTERSGQGYDPCRIVRETSNSALGSGAGSC